MSTPFHIVHTPEPLLSPLSTDNQKVYATIGLLTSEMPDAPLLLSLKHIEQFVEENVAVLIQRGLGTAQGFSNYQFTEYGADIMEDELPIIALSNLVLKYEPFTVEELFFLKNKQIIISSAPLKDFTNEMARFLYEKKITAVGFDFLKITDSCLQDTISQLVSAFLFSQRNVHGIQFNPLFLKSVYCYNGEICHHAISEHAGVPWKDLAELCWNWN